MKISAVNKSIRFFFFFCEILNFVEIVITSACSAALAVLATLAAAAAFLLGADDNDAFAVVFALTSYSHAYAKNSDMRFNLL